MRNLIAAVIGVSLLAAMPGAQAQAPPFLASPPPLGTATFDILQHGEVLGQWTFTLRQTEGRLILDETVTLNGPGSNTARFEVDARSLSPLRAETVYEGESCTSRADLTFAEGRVTGIREVCAPGADEPEPVPAFSRLSPGTTTRTMAVQLIGTLPFTELYSTQIIWYNSFDGREEAVTVGAAGPAPLQMPDGAVPAYRLDLTGGTPEATIYVAAESPRRILRIDISGTGRQYLRRESSR